MPSVIPVRYDGEDWITVHGAELRRDGVDLGQRVVLVRAARLALRVSSETGDRRRVSGGAHPPA